jgi:hypothetical protein
MSHTANDFLKLNLKFKAFESLLANTMVLLKAKEYRMKADIQKKAALLQSAFSALSGNVSVQR